MKSLEYLATRNAGRFDIVEKDGPRTVFRLALDNGASGIVEDWELFEGVNLTFNDIPHGSLTWKSSEPRSLHIEWCQQGRGEIASANGKSYFIHERECAVHDQRIIKRQMRYPMPRYVGLTLSIEYETGSSTLRAHDATGGVDFNASAMLAGTDAASSCPTTLWHPCWPRSTASTIGRASSACA